MSELRFINKEEVCRITSLSKTQIDRLEREDKFPTRIPLTEGRVVWIDEQIYEWMRRRIIEREPIILLREKEKAAAKARAEAKARFLSKEQVYDIMKNAKCDILKKAA